MAKKKEKRPFKGENINVFTDDYTVVDIETTGLSPEFEEIIEIGAIRVREGKETERFSELIKPEKAISPFITNLTGISNEMVQNAREAKEVLSDFREFLGDDVIVGHNVNFDVDFLYDHCAKRELAPLSNNYIDTLKVSRRVLTSLHHHRLSDLAEYYSVSYEGAHRAVNDCAITNCCYRRLFDRE
ncbi:MAG: 3'-5' exoribonuclease [Lachnospiraceae bacterium]|nr:3'-5' exoribonuclease [Lachnospiraceae bacterium]